jgi:hypothetical protein
VNWWPLILGVIVAVGSRWMLRQRDLGFIVFSSLEFVNAESSYELASLVVALAVVSALRVLAPERTGEFRELGDSSGPVDAVPQIGLRPAADETWRAVRRSIAVVITAVTLLVLAFEQFENGTLTMDVVRFVSLVVGFAAVNAFVEETVFRLGVVLALVERFSPGRAAVTSSGLFGTVNNFRVAPRGLAGLLTAGFVGWFLAKSVPETRELFWA